LGSSENGEPSTRLGNWLRTGIGWSSRISPPSTAWKSAIITGTFMVLAAWKLSVSLRT
jgi:hypothetical protein